MKKLILIIVYITTNLNLNSQSCSNVNSEFCSLNIGETTFFNFTGSNAGSTTYSWDFGDGTNSNLENPDHIFQTAGSFSVCLTITCVITTSTGGGYGGSGGTSTSVCQSSICETITISPLGCTDSTANNYNPIATINDGSCTNCIFGCTDIIASNYNPLATCDDNSCLDLNNKYFYDDFESFSAGEHLTANSNNWSNWSGNNIDCEEDVIITNLNSNSGSNSIYLESNSTSGGPTDIVLPFGTTTSYSSGSLNFSCNFFVQDIGAYFNFQSHYISGIGWSLDVSMDNNNNITFSNSSNSNVLLTAQYPMNSWFDLNIQVDLTNNIWYIYIDGVSIGSFTNNINQVASIDIYPLYNQKFFIDDISYNYNSLVIYGCTNPLSSNYDSLAVLEDGSCNCIAGCMDSTAFNYDPLATCDSTGGAICTALLYGCIDPTAINYYLSANTDDGSCLFYGCTDPSATNYDASAVIGCDASGSNSCCTYSAGCGQITGLNIHGVIHDRATFNWDNMNDTSCSVDQIRIQYREVGTSSYSTKTMGAPVGNNAPCLNTSKRILNLSPSTQYEYNFKIWYQDGTVVTWHAGGTFTTATICDNVTNVTATPVNTTKTNFCWTSPTSTYSFVRLKYREDFPGSSFSNIGGMGVMAPEICKTKNGLTPGTNYRVMWRTWCNPAGGPYRSAQWDGPVLWSQPTSIRVEAATTINNLDVYPNPSRDIFNVTFTSEDIQDFDVRIINVIGEVVYTEDLNEFVGRYTKQLDLSAYTKGVYFLEITTDNGVVNKKLILQ